MKKIFIFGAGSIGNHMTHACVKLGYDVYVTDKNSVALTRMKNQVYPKRYGKWNTSINQVKFSKLNKLNILFDLVIIGTPPSTHIELLKKIKNNLKFKKILIEKPLSTYLENFYQLKNEKNLFCGYNHSISSSFQKFLNLIEKQNKKQKILISIKWQESFKGILGAHFWLKNEYSSYLGNVKKGGGAIHEHSHGLHLAIYILNKLKIKNYKFSSNIFFKYKNKKPSYDVSSILKFENKKVDLILETDLLEDDALKKITFYNSDAKIIWHNSYQKNLDNVYFEKNNLIKNYKFKKNRSSEFEKEIKHILNLKNQSQSMNSPLNIEYSIEVMRIISRTLKNAKYL